MRIADYAAHHWWVAAAVDLSIGALIGGLEMELAARKVRRMARQRLAELRKDAIIRQRRELLTPIVTPRGKLFLEMRI